MYMSNDRVHLIRELRKVRQSALRSDAQIDNGILIVDHNGFADCADSKGNNLQEIASGQKPGHFKPPILSKGKR